MAKGSKAISVLTPKSFTIVIGGKEIRLAADKFENAIMNMAMIAEVRDMFHDQLKKIKDQDTLLTPREMKEITETAKNIIECSGGIYDKSEPLDNPRPAEKTVKSDDVVDFGPLKMEEQKKDDNPASQTGT